MTRNFFQEAARVIKPRAKLVISLPHPATLYASSQFRWTAWEPGQSQEKLVPGESVHRHIVGVDGAVLPIVNFYWPREVLVNFAERAGLRIDEIEEAKASEQELARYSGQLEPIFGAVPFFLVMSFIQG